SAIRLHSLDDLIRLDTPAILEIRRNNEEEPRIVAITAVGNGTFSIMPVGTKAQPIASNSLAAIWTGKGWIIWENRLGLPDRVDRSSSIADIRKLQRFLIREKKLQGKADGAIGKATVKALQLLQREAGLPADGTADERTMLLLNSRYATPPAPRLHPANGKSS
ncbi:MAG: ATPase, partial [Deltaproteobacteria bacterium]|nr:ATPase [Deltaproteobacteria bacterium]